MKVILTQNIKGLGRIGDIKNVSDGYARNLLFPRKMAKPATDSATKEVETLKLKAEAQSHLEEKEAREIARKIKDVTVVIAKKASASGKLFSSISKQEVAQELKKSGINISADSISFGDHGDHIKLTGQHVIQYHPSGNITENFTLEIKAEE